MNPRTTPIVEPPLIKRMIHTTRYYILDQRNLRIVAEPSSYSQKFEPIIHDNKPADMKYIQYWNPKTKQKNIMTSQLSKQDIHPHEQ